MSKQPRFCVIPKKNTIFTLFPFRRNLHSNVDTAITITITVNIIANNYTIITYHYQYC